MKGWEVGWVNLLSDWFPCPADAPHANYRMMQDSEGSPCMMPRPPRSGGRLPPVPGLGGAVLERLVGLADQAVPPALAAHKLHLQVQPASSPTATYAAASSNGIATSSSASPTATSSRHTGRGWHVQRLRIRAGVRPVLNTVN